MQHPEDHDITALAYDLIEGAEREALLEHLAECDSCRAVYDSYRDEQSVVREAIVRDARSGAAEAKALESTLKMLGAIGADTKTTDATQTRGRLLRLPLWVIAGQVAALLAVAVGLFFIMKPDPETTQPDAITVAENDRAPASVDEGVVYVRDTEGDWKQADAMPMDQWVMAGDSKVLSFTMANGSKAELQPDAVFRIALEDGSGQPVVYLLHGDGMIDTRNIAGDMKVRAGETSFVTMPGARFQLECVGEADRKSPRTWSQATYVGAQVLDGDIVLKSGQRGLNMLPLRHGEKIEWTPEKLQLFELDGNEMVIGLDFSFFPGGGEEGTPEQLRLLQRQLELLRPRLKDFEKRMQEHQGERTRIMLELDNEMRQLDFMFRPDGSTGVYDVYVVKDDAGALTVTSDGKTLSVRVSDSSAAVTYEATSLKALLEVLPERHRARLQTLEVETDKDGNLRISGGPAEASSGSDNGVKVKIIQRSESRD